ncbi:WD40-repeat-containing domain protein [Zopfochytrium polystomum]|nr:WD40-repeat-containing domain protein [Zopfochytrium polystomum]
MSSRRPTPAPINGNPDSVDDDDDDAIPSQAALTPHCLPIEVVDRILAFIHDHRTLARTSRVSRWWSSATAPHWRRLYLARWRPPRPSRAAAADAGPCAAPHSSQPQPSSEAAAAAAAEPVSWQILYRHRLAQHDRWRAPEAAPAARQIALYFPFYAAGNRDFLVGVALDGVPRVVRRRRRAEAADRDHEAPLQGCPNTAASAAGVSADGRCVAVGWRDGTVRVWDVATGACGLVLEGHRAPVLDVHMTARRIATISRDARDVKLWDRASGRLVRDYSRVDAHVRAAAAHSGLIAMITRDGVAKLWDVDADERSEAVVSHGEVFDDSWRSLMFDGKQIALQPQNKRVISVWNARTGDLVIHLDLGHNDMRNFCLDGSRLAAYCWRRSFISYIQVWDLESGQIVRQFDLAGQIVVRMEMDATALILSSMPKKGSIIWDFSVGISYAEDF